MTQQWIVGAIVLAAVCYALWYWLPAGLRQRLARIHPALGKKRDCGACSRCEACDAPQAHGSDLARPVHWQRWPTQQGQPD